MAREFAERFQHIGGHADGKLKGWLRSRHEGLPKNGFF
jgi:hypothetical protein